MITPPPAPSPAPCLRQQVLVYGGAVEMLSHLVHSPEATAWTRAIAGETLLNLSAAPAQPDRARVLGAVLLDAGDRFGDGVRLPDCTQEEMVRNLLCPPDSPAG